MYECKQASNVSLSPTQLPQLKTLFISFHFPKYCSFLTVCVLSASSNLLPVEQMPALGQAFKLSLKNIK